MSNNTEMEWDISCPPELRKLEAKNLDVRRKAAGRAVAKPDYQDCVGIALSGGGIRSATFALGLFQGLARLHLLKRVDFLSTVSGGGYFGGFFGRLIGRGNPPQPGGTELDTVEGLLYPDSPTADVATATRGRRILRWLRENGRYLAPTGSGDYLTALAVMLRNWFAIQTVVLLTLTALFLALRIGIAALVIAAPTRSFGDALGFRMELLNWPVWVSPILVTAGAVVVCLLVPLAWAYWIASLSWQDPKARLSRLMTNPFTGPLLIFGITAYFFYQEQWAVLREYMAPLGGLALLAILFEVIAQVTAALKIPRAIGETDRRHDVAKRLSDWLRSALLATLILGLLGLIDTVGQTVYALSTISRLTYWHWLFAVGSGLLTLVASGQKLVVKLSTTGKAWVPSVRLMAAAASIALILIVACGLDYVAQRIVWDAKQPATMPVSLHKWAQEQRCTELGTFCMQHGGCAPAAGTCLPPDPVAVKPVYQLGSYGELAIPTMVLGVLGVLAILTGAQWPFVNLSTLLPLYAARLTRAYLGASNPARKDGEGDDVTDPIAGDDVGGRAYWTGEAAPWERGGPVHLVNVTINETIDGRSQIQQRDRHGVGMAISAAGISVGVRNHRLWNERVAHPLGHKIFDEQGTDPEDLTLSQWIGISGAAVSTGMGFQTSFGLSILLGVLNVRLGYWWNSGVGRGLWSSLLFSVQRFLVLGEWLARFPGTAQRRWYLSDGGHFENTAAYELIRRHVPLIIISDAGADPNYRFDDLANLVRKARIDFDTEIVILEPEELGRMGQGPLGNTARFFGSLKELAPNAELTTTKTEFVLPRSPCAALARVFYPGDKREAWLIVLKPILHPNDPPDLVNYGKLNPTFPNETTADQFFDEAQWESYRKLGELTALRIFGGAGQGPFNVAGGGSPLELLRG